MLVLTQATHQIHLRCQNQLIRCQGENQVRIEELRNAQGWFGVGEAQDHTATAQDCLLIAQLKTALLRSESKNRI